MSHFKNATSEFKKRLADQPLIKRAVVTPIASQDDGPIYTGSNANPNNNGLQVFSSSKKKKTEGKTANKKHRLLILFFIVLLLEP